MKKFIFSIFVASTLLFGGDLVDLGNGKMIFEKVSVVEFKSGAIEIKDEFKEDLAELIAFLKQNKEYKLELNGRSDNDGNPVQNRALSKRRAIVMQNYLVSKGISKSRMKIIALGEKNPLATNDTPAGKEINRSVEIVLVK